MIKIYNGNCLNVIRNIKNIDVTFLDPPFNQGKIYREHHDRMKKIDYWEMMNEVVDLCYKASNDNASIYFMQREKNIPGVINSLEMAGWQLRNIIIWKKMCVGPPTKKTHAKSYQIIAYATKGKNYTFNRLRVDIPLKPNQKIERPNGVLLTDVWDDIRELTSGYFAGKEVLRNENGQRLHYQQSPLALLTRIIKISSNKGDTILDPFVGSGTTLSVAKQLRRNAIGIDVDKVNAMMAYNRVKNIRKDDKIDKILKQYL